jgi:hypothetical protein|tara:strand:- start:1345 stop:1722 length:378 start_codon:yes stop_codon:yes gene_type:complete
VVDNFIKRLPDFVNRDAWLIWRGRHLTTTFLLKSSQAEYFISISEGEIHQLVAGPQLLRPSVFTIKASDGAWLKHWMKFPPSGWHDIFAMVKIGEASIEGDLYPMMSNLRYIKELIALPRKMGRD